MDSNGNVYIADRSNHRIRRVGPDGVITTFAGTGDGGFSGDDGPATQAQLDSPPRVAVDANGNVYIADVRNNRIRRVDPEGVITTFAGTGVPGFSGDGGPAAEAELNTPQGMAVDADGNVYIADSVNQRIRRVGPDGVITTFAGTGDNGFFGDDGPATEAQLSTPFGVALDSDGNVYIVDVGNHRIRVVGTDGVIATFAGFGSFSGDGGPAAEAHLSFPRGVALDSDGNVYISDLSNRRIRRVDPEGVITTFAGTGVSGFIGDGGPATQAELTIPVGLALDADGNVYIADVGSHQIRRVDPGGVITTFAGREGDRGFSGDGGPATEAQLNSPRGVAVDAEGNVYIADAGNNRVRRVDPEGIITTFAGTGGLGFSDDGVLAVEAQLAFPRGVAVDDEGNVYIADTTNRRIRRVNLEGVITTFAGTGERGFSGDGGPAAQAELNSPQGVALDADGNVYIADVGNQRIRRVGPGGVITTFAGTGEAGFSGDGGPAAEAQLTGAQGVAVDAEGNVYIVDTGNHRIRRVEAAEGQEPGPGPEERVDFVGDIQPIIDANCAVAGCHVPDGIGPMSLEAEVAFEELLNPGIPFQPRVIPGNPENSIVVERLEGRLQPQMPLDQDPLPTEEIALIRRWIAEGGESDCGASGTRAGSG